MGAGRASFSSRRKGKNMGRGAKGGEWEGKRGSEWEGRWKAEKRIIDVEQGGEGLDVLSGV